MKKRSPAPRQGGPSIPISPGRFIPEYMVIRNHLYNLISKCEGGHLQIPSENELCQLFGVSRVTVRGAIKGMVQDRFLIPKRGMGTFINPEKIDRAAHRVPVIGLIHGDGRSVTSPMRPAVAACIEESGMVFEWLFLPDSRSPARFVELVRSGMDAVVWWNTGKNPLLATHGRALRTSGIPVLVIDTEGCEIPPGLDGATGNPGARGVAVAEYLHRFGNSRLLLAHPFGPGHVDAITRSGSTHAAFVSRMADLRAPEKPVHGVRPLADLPGLLADKAAFLAQFDVIYAKNTCVAALHEMLCGAGLEIGRDVSLLSYEKVAPVFCGGRRVAHVDIETSLQAQLSRWLIMRLRQRDDSGVFRGAIEAVFSDGDSILPRTR